MTQNWTGGRFLSGSFRFSNPNILRTNNSSRSERLSPFEGGGRDERERLSSSIYLSNELLISMRYPISPSNPRSFRRIWSGRPTTMTRSISRAIAICAALTPLLENAPVVSSCLLGIWENFRMLTNKSPRLRNAGWPSHQFSCQLPLPPREDFSCLGWETFPFLSLPQCNFERERFAKIVPRFVCLFI